MTIEWEAKTSIGLKALSASGEGCCLFSRYGVIDADNDYTSFGYLPHGATAPMLISHTWQAVPVGKGRIRSEKDGGYFDFQLAGTLQGKELGEWLRFDLANGSEAKSEFSYGFTVLEGGSSRGVIEGKSVRLLHGAPGGAGCRVHEVSYCLRGSGVGTQLVAMKSSQRYAWARRAAELDGIILAQQRSLQEDARRLHQRFLTREQERMAYER